MPRSCCVNGCNNSMRKKAVGISESAVSFHSFPKNENENSMWKYYIRACNNQEVVGDKSVICSDHFKESDFIKTNAKIILNKFAVPCIFPNSETFTIELLPDETHDDPLRKDDVESTEVLSTFTVNDDIGTSIGANTWDISVNMSSVQFSPIQSSQVQSTQIYNAATESPLNIIHATPKSRPVRYPGDIDESCEMSPETAKRNISLCTAKIKSQAKEIYRLKQTVKRQAKQIENFKELIRKMNISRTVN